jgi:YD repeat-containing protein
MQTLLGEKNNLIGYTKASGNLTYIYDKSMRMLGSYDSSSNQTLDVNQRLVGRGNLLPMLLK